MILFTPGWMTKPQDLFLSRKRVYHGDIGKCVRSPSKAVAGERIVLWGSELERDLRVLFG